MKRFFKLRNLAAMALALMGATTLGSCDVVYDDLPECVVTNRLRFVYDYNLKWADAFAHEVKSIHLIAFDEAGEVCLDERMLVTDDIIANGYLLPEDKIVPGHKYHFLAWCGADNNPGDEHFTVAKDFDRIEKREHATCYLTARNYTDGKAWTDKPLHSLFHGTVDLDIPAIEGVHADNVYTMKLKKDTNKWCIMLQNLSGEDLDVNDFEFVITDANGSMAHDNELIDDEEIAYYAHSKFSGTAGVEIRDPLTASRAITQVSMARADLTVPRLMMHRSDKMFLTINRLNTTDERHKLVARIPLIDYAMLARDFEYINMPGQEYLDRQDDYSLLLFLENGTWLSSQVVINSWRVVFNDYPLE